MFGGEQGANGPQHNTQGSVSQPKVVFVGSALSFSDQIIRIANVEFDGVLFERYDTLDDVSANDVGQDSLIALVFDEMLADDLISAVENCTYADTPCQIVLGYRDINLAASVFQRLSVHGDQCVVSYLPMGQQFDIWLSIMRLLLCGGKYIPDELIEDLAGVGSEVVRPAAADADLSELTDREREVLALVSKGKPNKTIASELDLSEHTIKLHIHHVITKLGVHNRTEAAIMFLSGGSAGGGTAHC